METPSELTMDLWSVTSATANDAHLPLSPVVIKTEFAAELRSAIVGLMAAHRSQASLNQMMKSSPA